MKKRKDIWEFTTIITWIVGIVKQSSNKNEILKLIAFCLPIIKSESVWHLSLVLASDWLKIDQSETWIDSLVPNLFSLVLNLLNIITYLNFRQ